MTVENMKKFHHHIFLLRSPKACMESAYRVTKSNSAEGNYFDASEAGFKELVENYKWIKEHVEADPLVLDGDDFVDPEKMTRIFKHVCGRIGMEFEPSMLTWEKKKIDDAFGAFHDGINNSTGIKKIEHEAIEFPKEVTDAIAVN